MADLTQEEFMALRSQGMPIEQIARLDPDSVRASGQSEASSGVPIMDRVAPYALAAGGAAALGGAGVAGARAMRGASMQRMAGQAGKEVGRDRGPVGAALRVLGAGREPVAPPVPASAPSRIPAAPKPSASLAYVTEADIKALPQLKNYQPGEEIRRATLERYKEVSAAPAVPDRTKAKITPIRPKVSRETRAPIKIVDAKKPKASRDVKQRGQTKREIASRQKGMAATRPPAPVAAADDDLMAQLEKSLAAEQEMGKLGVQRGPGSGRNLLRRGLGGAGKLAGPLGFLLSIGDIPDQMREADRMVQERSLEMMRRKDPRLARYLEDLNYPEDI